MSLNNHDLLTNLSNYDALVDRLKSTAELNYILIDIDNFSNINNAYGFDVGSRVLQKVAEYLSFVKPNKALLYRLFSDSFVILDEQTKTKEELIANIESILSFFSMTELTISETIEFRVSLSIGISRGVGLINIGQAEIAINELRKIKRNHFNFYDSSSPFAVQEQKNIYWIQKIKEAIVEDGIVAYYQPIVNNHTDKIEKFECLARLKDEEEIISPYRFLESAKVTGNLSFVTRSLISQSFEKFSGTEYEFSINITGEDLALDYLEPLLLKKAQKYNIDPSRVVLEMLEGITTLDCGTTLQQLSSLRKKGFQIAIDDFGSENSNMSRLLEIEPDYLKIDGAFIKNIITDVKSQIIVDAIIMICKRSGIKIIAEYIHNEEVQNRIKELGIDYSQGYFFAEPSAELVTDLS